MKLEEILADLEEDFEWNEADLGFEMSKSSKLFIKYLKMYSEENTRLKRYENAIKQLLQEKRDYYSGNAPPEVYKEKPFNLKIRSDAGIQKYVDADMDVIKAKEKIILQEQKVEVLAACMDEIKRRGYNIGKRIDYERFISGA